MTRRPWTGSGSSGFTTAEWWGEGTAFGVSIMRGAIIQLITGLCVAVVPAHGQTTDAAGKALTLVGVQATPLSEVRLRAGPSLSSSVLGLVQGGTCLRVIEDRGAWLKVRVCNSLREGFVYRPRVSTSADVVVDRLLRDDPSLRSAPLAPPVPRRPPPGASDHTKRTAEIWNQYGGLLERLCAELHVDPAAAIAVLAAESGGTAFVQDRPVIRFENHLFWDTWGTRNAATFERHFRFRRMGDRTREHQFRPADGQPWRTFHDQGQEREWSVLEFARRLERASAYRSTSWGLPQILGANHRKVGYGSVEEMVASFSDPRNGARMQILAFFDFVRGRLRNAPGVMALRRRDWTSFAQLYNGPGREEEYIKPLSTYYDAATSLLSR